MKEIILDCAEITDKKQLHALIAEKLNFPDWYGGNLDALYDCLTGVYDEINIVLKNFARLEENLGSYALSVRKVLLKADEDNERITAVIG